MDKNDIAKALIQYVVQTPSSGGINSSLNKALAKLRAKIEGKIDELTIRLNELKGLKPKWEGVINLYNKKRNEFEIIPQFQVQVCKWSDFRKGKTKGLEYKVDQISKVADSSGKWNYKLGDAHSLYPKDKDLSSNSQIGKYVNDYFNALFCENGAPLEHVGILLDELNKKYAGRYHVTLSLDFYYTRPLTALGLHKDTTGNTLFVGLHYNNTEDMVGPEYIYDFWPKFKERAYSPHHIGKGNSDNGVTFWPTSLREGLEIARSQIKEQKQDTQDLLYVTEMSPNGLISFVDELIFHQTPLTRRRKSGDERDFRDAGFNSITVDFAKEIGLNKMTHQDPPRLRRQFSEKNMEEYWKERGTGGKARRSFVRFWAMVEPVQWFVK